MLARLPRDSKPTAGSTGQPADCALQIAKRYQQQALAPNLQTALVTAGVLAHDRLLRFLGPASDGALLIADCGQCRALSMSPAIRTAAAPRLMLRLTAKWRCGSAFLWNLFRQR